MPRAAKPPLSVPHRNRARKPRRAVVAFPPGQSGKPQKPAHRAVRTVDHNRGADADEIPLPEQFRAAKPPVPGIHRRHGASVIARYPKGIQRALKRQGLDRGRIGADPLARGGKIHAAREKRVGFAVDFPVESAPRAVVIIPDASRRSDPARKRRGIRSDDPTALLCGSDCSHHARRSKSDDQNVAIRVERVTRIIRGVHSCHGRHAVRQSMLFQRHNVSPPSKADTASG